MAIMDERFKEVRHRNMWGQWVFRFEGANLCGLSYESDKAGNLQAIPSEVKACAGAKAMPDTSLSRKTAAAYKKAAAELSAYLTGKLRTFTIPISIIGTEFQVEVWEKVREIPYGETRTFRQIAEAVGHPGAERAVGNALHANPLQIIIPCHRVISSNGGLSGYALGTDIKRRLLCMEGAIQNELELE
jgi:methylated-DNA-[protein]-cysteine S-methyltransferase